MAFDTGSATASGTTPSCGGSSAPVDLWYAYTATFSGDAMFDLCGSSFDTRLAIYDACGGTELACNDDNGPGCSGTTSSIQMTVTSGTTYYVQVGGYGTATGTGDLTIQQVLNDDCASATAINEVTDLAFDTGSATASGTTPSCGGSTAPVDLWYAYTPTTSGNAVIDLCGSGFDTRLAVYDACGGAELACNDDACGLQSSLTVTVTSGTTYYIQVGGYNGATGSGDLSIHFEDTWTGATSSDWNDGTNWNSGYVPSEIVDVTIPGGVTNYPVLNSGNFTVNNASGTYKCKSLTIENGGQLEVYHSNDMLVYGDVTIASGATLLLGDDLDVKSGGNLVISGGTVSNNYNTGHYGDIYFRDGSTGSMNGGTLTAYDQLEFYNTSFSATGGEIHCGGTNDETSIVVQSAAANLYDFVVDANCKAALTSYSNNTLQVHNFMANSGSGFTIASGKAVQVNGDATFVADAAGLASLIEEGSFNVSGNLDYQQYLTADAWHQVSPVTTPATTGIYTDIYLYSWSEPDSLYSWHSVVYDPLNLGEGYFVWSPGSARTVHYDAGFNTSDVAKNLSYTPSSYYSTTTAGYNLVGNPFPSYLNHTNSWTTTNVDATIYIWNSSTGNYITMNPNISGTDSIIPPGQGFFMKANAAGASVTIPASERTQNKNTSFYKGDVGLYLTLKIEGNGSEDRIMLIPNPEATYGFDNEYDAYDLKGAEAAPQLYMPVNGIEYSVNVVPEILESDVYPVALQVGKTNQYKISLLNSELSEEFGKILLEDLQTQTIVDLKKTDYMFVANKNDLPHRFNLRFAYPEGISTDVTGFVNVYSLRKAIYVQSDIHEGEIKVFDMLGQLVAEKTIGNRIEKIEMPHAAGYYMVEVSNQKKMLTRKVYIK